MENPTSKLENLEDRIIDLSVQLKNAKSEIKSIKRSHKELIREVTHSLKNSVGVMVSFSEMILNDLEIYDENKLKKHLSIINDSGECSIHFLNQTTHFSRLVSSKSAPLYATTNYISLLNEIIDNFSFSILQKEVTINRKFENVIVDLSIDEEEMTLAISQIIQNAIRFSSIHATLSISVVETNEFIETEIKDNGIGVSEVDIEKIFNEFYVVNTFSRDKVKCVGLGLTIAEKIIKNHRGTISFESVLGEGSSVKICLPKMRVLTVCK